MPEEPTKARGEPLSHPCPVIPSSSVVMSNLGLLFLRGAKNEIFII